MLAVNKMLRLAPTIRSHGVMEFRAEELHVPNYATASGFCTQFYLTSLYELLNAPTVPTLRS